MRVFLVGASGAIGSRLVPQLIDAGHEVVGTHNSPASAEHLRTLGATPVTVDLLDARAVLEAVLEHEPEAIVHEATALADAKFGRDLDRTLARTSELRTKGADALLAAAWEVGTRRFVAQSVAFWRYAREGGAVKTEDDPLDPTPPAWDGTRRLPSVRATSSPRSEQRSPISNASARSVLASPTGCVRRSDAWSTRWDRRGWADPPSSTRTYRGNRRHRPSRGRRCS